MLGGAPGARVAANGTAFHVAAGGAGGPAVVCLHYFAGSGLEWDAVAARLAGEYHCVAPDLRGHGDSAALPDAYAVADGADDVAGVVAALGITDYALVGHSMGGKLALALAARRPPGLRALVLVAPSPPTPEPIPDAERARLLASHGDRRAAEETADAIVARPLPPAPRARVVADNLRTSPAAWRAWLARGSREDVSALASHITVPTLVVAGTADRTIPEALLAREVVPRVAGARLAVVPGAGHLVPLEAPEALAGLVAAELRTAFGRPRPGPRA